MLQLENELHIKKVQTLNEKIEDELSMIENYESQIDDLREEISDYENEYDYESDPNGNDFDLNHIHNLNEEIEVIENFISRCESEIQIIENEIKEMCKLIILNNTIPKLNSIDDLRKHFGYISSANILKLWINQFGINELVNDLKWIYRDDISKLKTILK